MQDSNLQPLECESSALAVELITPIKPNYNYLILIDELFTKIFKDGVGPAKAGLRRVGAFGWWLARLYHIVFFQKYAVFVEPVQIGAQPLHGYPLGFLVVAVALQALDHQKV